MPTTLELLRDRFGEQAWTASQSQKGQNQRITVPSDAAFSYLEFLHSECGFTFLADLTCVDYLYFPKARDRFGLVYNLVHLDTNERLIVRTYLNEPGLSIRSVVPLWEGANWLEREVYDMFGILFEGHPDLRRVLLPDEFADFPLRKDYPLRGRGERHNFERITRAES